MTMADTIAVMNEGRIEQMGEPTALYESPETTFVANFLGQSNLVKGAIGSRSGSDLAIDVHGQKVGLPKDRCFTDQDAVWFGIRPEKISLTAPADAAGTSGTGGLSGTVTDTSFSGVATQYLVRMPWGQHLTVVRQNDGSEIRRPGDEVTLQWDQQYAFALDASQNAQAGQDFGEGETAPHVEAAE